MAYQFTDKQLTEAIKGSAGIMSTIARKLGCDWNTANSHIEKSEVASQALQDEREKILDVAESVLYQSIQEDKNTQDAKWLLATKGRGRGYVTRQEQKISGDFNLSDVVKELKGA